MTYEAFHHRRHQSIARGRKTQDLLRVDPTRIAGKFSSAKIDTPQFDSFTRFQFAPGSSNMEMSLFHQPNFPDPILYGHMTDTVNGQIHILLYVLNDPTSPRFDVDKMPDGRITQFGTLTRNIEAEQAALEAGLAPGQVRRGLRIVAGGCNRVRKFHRRPRTRSIFRRAIVLSQRDHLRALWFCISAGTKVDGTHPSGILGEWRPPQETGWLTIPFTSMRSTAFVCVHGPSMMGYWANRLRM